MRIKLIAPDGKKIRDIRTLQEHGEVIIDDAIRKYFVVADSDEDPIIEEVDGVTLGDRVSDLEDAVIELAEIISEVE